MNKNIDLSDFEPKDTLNPDIFDLKYDKMHLDVREKLLEIAKDFFTYLKINVEYSDIWLIGSNANYNWSVYSDIDVHLLLDYNEVSDNNIFVTNFFDSKKLNWNNEHDIKIKNFEVETYVQDSNKTENMTIDGGIYSILNDRWIKHPEKLDINLDKEKIQSFVNDFLKKFKGIINGGGDLSDNLENLSDKLYELRNQGFNSKSEFSPENIAFKYLRRMGVKDKIKDIKNHAYDTKMSLSHGATLGSNQSHSQRILSGNKAHVANKDSLTKYDEKKSKKDEKYSDGITYSIHGVIFDSLRDAAKKIGEKKSTIQYRVHSKNPKYNDYKIIYNN